MKKIAVFAFCIISLMFTSSCVMSENEAEPISNTKYELLNTVCTISVYGMSKTEAESAISGAFELCEKYENMLSRTKEGSDICRLNESQGEEIEISEETYELLEKSKHYSEISSGAFDVSIGKLSILWDFQAQEPKVPQNSDIEDAVKHINYKNIILKKSADRCYAQKSDSEMKIDLGGIAKGYIVDRTVEYLEEKGVKSGIVNFGGNVSAIGERLDGKSWKIGIEKPFSDRKEVVGMVERKNATVVTSGIYERSFAENGKLYHHILDIKTGYPVESDVQSVSISMKKGKSADADALSSICLIKGSEEGLKLLKTVKGAEAAFLLKNGKIISTDGMDFKEMN